MAEHAFAPKTLPDAVRLRNQVLTTFERADAEAAKAPPGALTSVLVGGGPTAVELPGGIQFSGTLG